MRKIPTFKKILSLSLFFLASTIFASPVANPNNISNQTTTMYPTVIRGNPGSGLPFGNLLSSLQQYTLIYNTTPGSYNQSVDLQPFLQADPKAKLVVYIAGGQGGWHQLPGTAATFVGGTGGITIFTAPLSNFIKQFGNNVSFYYVVGGAGQTLTNSGSGGGGGASMVAVNNWPHDGGTTLAIAGGGGGAATDIYNGNNAGGGGGGNDCGENGNPIPNINPPAIGGGGGCQGKGGNSGTAQGGSANPNLIDIAGGGGGSGNGGQNGWYCAGAGGGTGGPGQLCNGWTYINGSFFGGLAGLGYQDGGNGAYIFNSTSSNGSYAGGTYGGGYGGGGGSTYGWDAGGGGGYGGGGGGWIGAGGGGGGYCLDANHSPANNPSLGAELGSSCQASDWTNGGGNYGNGYVYVYIQP